MFPSSLYDTNHNTIALARPCNICSRYCIYHVKFTSYCESIERSRPIRFFIVRCIITLVICVWGYTYHGDTHITVTPVGGSTIMEVGYLEAFSKIWDQSWIEWKERGPTKTFLTDFIHEVSSDSFISTKDILICLVLGVAFTILRCLLTAAFFKVRISRNFKHKLCKFYFFSENWFH